MTSDLKYHFLASPMNNPEYMKISQCHIPPVIIQTYDLTKKFHKVKKGMYGLKQEALVAYNFLVENL